MYKRQHDWFDGVQPIYVGDDVTDSAGINKCVRPVWRYYLLFWPPRRSARVLGVLARGVLGLLTRTFDFHTEEDGTFNAAVDDASNLDPAYREFLCGNQNFTAVRSPSTRRLLDGVAVSVPHRSTEPARPRHRREMT